jgi:hypothetical protein
MNYKGIEQPQHIKSEHLSISQALGILSLLPLAKPEDPVTLLRRLMLENWTPGILIAASDGKEWPILQQYWQSAPSAEAFQKRDITIRFAATPATLWKPVDVPGHVVIRRALLRRAALDGALIQWPETPETWAGCKQDNLYRQVVVPAMQGARAAAFDEAVERWEDQGEAATAVQKPTINVRTRKEAEVERVARQAGRQAGRPIAQTPTLSERRWKLKREDKSESAGSPLAALAVKVETQAPTRKQPMAKRTRSTPKEKTLGIQNRIKMVVAKATRIWRDPAKAPSPESMAQELCRITGKCEGYGEETVRQILEGRYKPQKDAGISGYR